MSRDPGPAGEPYVDVDEWRDAPVRHRHVHGGFAGTHTRFSFYFPPPELYRGRFFQYLEGGSGGREHLVPLRPWVLETTFNDLGGYAVESNQGHFADDGTTGFGSDWELFGASAESAVFAKTIAAEMYGAAPRYGYVWGGSGGGSRSIYCLENRPDVYDGGAPHVIWSTPVPGWCAIGLWWLHAREKLADIIDAAEPGGSGDPFATLDAVQTEALAALYRYGYPRGAESQLWAFSPWMWGFSGLTRSDPGYFQDFWTRSGYIGHDNPGRVQDRIVDFTTTVTEVLPGEEEAADLRAIAETFGSARNHSNAIGVEAGADPDRLFGATATFLTGAAKGRKVIVSHVAGDRVSTSIEFALDMFSGVAVGDQVRFDNRDFIAWCHYFLHALRLDHLEMGDGEGGRRLAPGYEGLRAYAVDGRPLFPQRPLAVSVGPGGHTGRFETKMIHIGATLDANVWPLGVAAYSAKVRQHLGRAIGDHYRLWWVENATHGTPEYFGPILTPEKDPEVWKSRLVEPDGVTAQALRDLVAWVEEGIPPPPTTGHAMSPDGALRLAAGADERRSVQPVVTAAANGAARAEVRVGEPVRLAGLGEMAKGMGLIVAAEWDVTGAGPFQAFACDGASERVAVETEHVYDQPGTYFPSFRVSAHRLGAQGRPPWARNNARVRVVVRP